MASQLERWLAKSIGQEYVQRHERFDAGDFIVAFFTVWKWDAYHDYRPTRTDRSGARQLLLEGHALHRCLEFFHYDGGADYQFRLAYSRWEWAQRRQKQPEEARMEIGNEVAQVVKLAEQIRALSPVSREYLKALVAAGTLETEASVVKPVKRTYRKRSQVPQVTRKPAKVAHVTAMRLGWARRRARLAAEAASKISEQPTNTHDVIPATTQDLEEAAQNSGA